VTLRHPDLIGAAIVAALGIIVIVGGVTTPDPGFGFVNAGTFPVVLGTLMIVSAAWLAWDTVRAGARPVREEIDRRPLAGSALASALFLAVFVPLGFVLSATAYLVVQARLLGSRALIRDAVACVLFVLGIYFLFVRFLTVPLPRGPLPF
jgi:tripartite tricarboxylate transporter TctB family protein